MGLLDGLGDKAKDMMNDPEQMKQIEQLAKDKGISMEQAVKEHFAKQNTNNTNG